MLLEGCTLVLQLAWEFLFILQLLQQEDVLKNRIALPCLSIVLRDWEKKGENPVRWGQTTQLWTSSLTWTLDAASTNSTSKKCFILFLNFEKHAQ